MLLENKIFRILELFFIFSFTFFTYKYNVFIAVGIFPLLFVLTKPLFKSAAYFIILFVFISILYLYLQGIGSCIRVIKTMVVLLPFYFDNIISRKDYTIGKYLDYYMKINALLVCVDFILYFLIGRTLMTFTISGGILPRPCGFAEDSNFFSYTMLVYIFYKKWMYNRVDKLFIISLFLSGSLSALIFFFAISIVTSFRYIYNSNSSWLKKIIILFSLTIIIIYNYVAINPDSFLSFLSELNVNDFIRIKLISLSQRLNTVSNSMMAMDSLNELLVGIGAGKTRALSDLGLNMHNSLLQLFLEMGLILLIPVLIILISMALKIKDIKWTILFCSILLLSLIMETLYSPMLAFVYYLSKSKAENAKVSNIATFNTICSNIQVN